MLGSKGKKLNLQTQARNLPESTKLNQKLEPNKLYKVDDYSYLTDKSGRVSKVSGELKLETKDRNMYQQRKAVEIKDGVKGEDQGGHLIARIFNGPGEQINYIPQNAKLNNGKWRAMEAKWQKALEEGKKVEIEIKINYNETQRPTDFEIIYYINGKRTKELFLN